MRPTRAEATTLWADAMRDDGWFNLAVLGAAVAVRPLCGALGCRRNATMLDPAGVGWCREHRTHGLIGVARDY